MNKPRRDQIPYLDRVLNAAQLRRLLKWLHVDQLSYAEACKQLWEQFGIKSNVGHLHRFYVRNVTPRSPVPSKHGRAVILDLRITPRGKGFQFLILQRASGFRVFIQGIKLKTAHRTRAIP